MSIRKIRTRYQISLPKLADKTNYSKSLLEKLERGEKRLTPAAAVMISRALNNDKTVLHECCAGCPVQQELLKREISAGTEIKRKSDKVCLASASL